MSKASYFYPPRVKYQSVSAFDTGDVEIVKVEDLKISGALAPAIYIVGSWKHVFKWPPFYARLMWAYKDIRCLLKLRGHPHIVLIQNIVVIEDGDSVAGFSTPFIPGGTLDDRSSIRAKWFTQLMRTADDMNKIHHIYHRDIAPRNILIDTSENIRLFDFEHASIEDPTYDTDAASVIITVYETITKRGPDDDGEVDWIQDKDRVLERAKRIMLLDWTPVVDLDVEPSILKRLLSEWETAREHKEYTWTSFASERVDQYPTCLELGHSG